MNTDKGENSEARVGIIPFHDSFLLFLSVFICVHLWLFPLKGHQLAAAYRPHLDGHTLAVCFMTEAEL